MGDANSANKRILASYSYDSVTNYLKTLDYGNGDGVQYTYDSQGRTVAQAWEDNDTVTYAYDNSGGLASIFDSATGRTNGTTAYSYIYTGGQLMQMTVGSNTLTFTYDATGTPLSVTYNDTTYYYAVNLQGDVVAILDRTGTAMVSYTYDAWGNLCDTTGTLATTLGAHNPLRYRGYVYDTETGLYYLQSRYYNPTLGRFLNADALVSTGQGMLGNNMFAYCGNNPAVRCDISGQSYTATCFSDKEPFFRILTAAGSSSTGALIINVVCLLVIFEYVKDNVAPPLRIKNTGQEETLPNQGEISVDPTAPPVDAGKQGKHVPGHSNFDPDKSSWPEGKNGVEQTQEAWGNGVQDPKVPNGNVRIGIASDGTVVRVHIDGKGLIHGYPLYPVCFN